MNEKSEKIQFWAEQHVLIKFSVYVWEIPVETKKFLNSSSCRPSVSGVLIYKWHKQFSDGT